MSLTQALEVQVLRLALEKDSGHGVREFGLRQKNETRQE
jgi:hypothetical protein